jgi:hypothetical protein
MYQDSQFQGPPKFTQNGKIGLKQFHLATPFRTAVYEVKVQMSVFLQLPRKKNIFDSAKRQHTRNFKQNSPQPG